MTLTGDTEEGRTEGEVEALSEEPRRQQQERGWLERATEAELRGSDALKLAAIVLIVAVGLAHLRGALPHYRFAPYIGVGFVVNFVGALVAAAGITGMHFGGGC
jgi:hypothetical protein